MYFGVGFILEHNAKNMVALLLSKIVDLDTNFRLSLSITKFSITYFIRLFKVIKSQIE